MKQGELWYIDLNPTVGSEQAGIRPVVILSGNLMNEHLNLVICCPLTTKIKNYKGNLVLEPDDMNNLTQKSEIRTLHIRSLSKSRLLNKIGNITLLELESLKTSLNEILRY